MKAIYYPDFYIPPFHCWFTLQKILTFKKKKPNSFYLMVQRKPVCSLRFLLRPLFVEVASRGFGLKAAFSNQSRGPFCPNCCRAQCKQTCWHCRPAFSQTTARQPFGEDPSPASWGAEPGCSSAPNASGSSCRAWHSSLSKQQQGCKRGNRGRAALRDKRWRSSHRKEKCVRNQGFDLSLKAQQFSKGST